MYQVGNEIIKNEGGRRIKTEKTKSKVALIEG
jgi:hypothetical protein